MQSSETCPSRDVSSKHPLHLLINPTDLLWLQIYNRLISAELPTAGGGGKGCCSNPSYQWLQSPGQTLSLMLRKESGTLQCTSLFWPKWGLSGCGRWAGKTTKCKHMDAQSKQVYWSTPNGKLLKVTCTILALVSGKDTSVSLWEVLRVCNVAIMF